MTVHPSSVRVLWSGGFDSTALLLDHLRQGHVVEAWTLPTDAGRYWEKTAREREARERIVAMLPDAYRSRLKLPDAIPYDDQVYAALCGEWAEMYQRDGDVWFPQAALVAAASGLVGRFEAGYVRGDDTLSQASVVDAFNRQSVAVPLARVTKRAIWRHAATVGHDEVLRLTWTCEIPHGGKPCDRCLACKRRARAMR